MGIWDLPLERVQRWERVVDVRPNDDPEPDTSLREDCECWPFFGMWIGVNIAFGFIGPMILAGAKEHTPYPGWIGYCVGVEAFVTIMLAICGATQIDSHPNTRCPCKDCELWCLGIVYTLTQTVLTVMVWMVDWPPSTTIWHPDWRVNAIRIFFSQTIAAVILAITVHGLSHLSRRERSIIMA